MEVAGNWRGEYSYDPIEGVPSIPAIAFSMSIERSWLGSFAGVAIDDLGQGLPNHALIQGRTNRKIVRFRKTPEAFLTLGPAGARPASQFLQEELGTNLERGYPPPHILYQGQLDLAGERMSGTWVILPYRIILRAVRKAVEFHETTGTWWAARIPKEPPPEGVA